MKKKSLIGVGLAVALSIGTIISVSADTNDNFTGNGRGRYNTNSRRKSDTTCPGYGVVTRARGYEIIENILIEKFDLTEEYLDNAFNDGKNLAAIIEEKNIDIEELKKEFTTIRLTEIDEAIENGDITKEEGEIIKENFLSNEDHMNFENHMGNGFNGRGMRNGHSRGRGQRRGACFN